MGPRVKRRRTVQGDEGGVRRHTTVSRIGLAEERRMELNIKSNYRADTEHPRTELLQLFWGSPSTGYIHKYAINHTRSYICCCFRAACCRNCCPSANFSLCWSPGTQVSEIDNLSSGWGLMIPSKVVEIMFSQTLLGVFPFRNRCAGQTFCGTETMTCH